MEEFNIVKEVCGKVASCSEQIAELEESIVRMHSHGEKDMAEKMAEVQVTALEQLQKLALILTECLVAEEEEESGEEAGEVNEDEAEGGSVFMAGELDVKKRPIENEAEYPVPEDEGEDEDE